MQDESHFTLKRRFKSYTELALKRDPEITILVFHLPADRVFIPQNYKFTREEWEELEALEMAGSPDNPE